MFEDTNFSGKTAAEVRAMLLNEASSTDSDSYILITRVLARLENTQSTTVIIGC